MRLSLAVLAASFYGVGVRLLFGTFNNILETMSISALVLSPLIVGFLTILFTKKGYVRSYGHAFGLPWITCAVLLAITVFFGMEGFICWAMIFPFFGVAAGIGGIMAYAMLKSNHRKMPEFDFEEKPKGDDIVKVSAIVFLPFFLGIVEKDKTSVTQYCLVKKEIVIASPAARVWQQLADNSLSARKDAHFSFTGMMGFPSYVSTLTDSFKVGGNRLATYKNGLFFKETIEAITPNKLLVLSIHTEPEKIPPTTLDEHILIGGKHLDILEDRYTLTPLANGTTRLALSGRFMIHTPFNWYAKLWADFLMGDILHGQLELIKQKCAMPQH